MATALAYVVVLVLALAWGVGFAAETLIGRERVPPALLWMLVAVALTLPVLTQQRSWRVVGYTFCVIESVYGMLVGGFAAFMEWFYIEAHSLGAGPRLPDYPYLYGNLASAVLFLLALVCTSVLIFTTLPNRLKPPLLGQVQPGHGKNAAATGLDRATTSRGPTTAATGETKWRPAL